MDKKDTAKASKMKYQSSHKKKYKLPLTNSTKGKQVTTTEFGPRRSRPATQRRKKGSDRSSPKY